MWKKYGMARQATDDKVHALYMVDGIDTLKI
jgi:hypothetical protein